MEQQVSDIRYDDLIKSLSSIIDMFNFKGETISAEFVKNYVDRIVVRSDHVYEWMVNLDGKGEDFLPEKYKVKSNTPLKQKAEMTEALQEEQYQFSFTIGLTYDMALAYRQKFGKYLRESQWDDLLVLVYVRV